MKRATRVQCSWIFTFTVFGNLCERYPFNDVKLMIYLFTILINYFPKKSPSILLRVEPHLNFGVVIFKLLLKDNTQRQSVLRRAVTNMQKYNWLVFWNAYFFFIIMKLKAWQNWLYNWVGTVLEWNLKMDLLYFKRLWCLYHRFYSEFLLLVEVKCFCRAFKIVLEVVNARKDL